MFRAKRPRRTARLEALPPNPQQILPTRLSKLRGDPRPAHKPLEPKVGTPVQKGKISSRASRNLRITPRSRRKTRRTRLVGVRPIIRVGKTPRRPEIRQARTTRRVQKSKKAPPRAGMSPLRPARASKINPRKAQVSPDNPESPRTCSLDERSPTKTDNPNLGKMGSQGRVFSRAQGPTGLRKRAIPSRSRASLVSKTVRGKPASRGARVPGTVRPRAKTVETPMETAQAAENRARAALPELKSAQRIRRQRRRGQLEPGKRRSAGARAGTEPRRDCRTPGSRAPRRRTCNARPRTTSRASRCRPRCATWCGGISSCLRTPDQTVLNASKGSWQALQTWMLLHSVGPKVFLTVVSKLPQRGQRTGESSS